MIPVAGFTNSLIGVLGLCEAGLATARALQAGGATALCWDDDAGLRERASTEGFAVEDLSRRLESIDSLIVSESIAFLYPEPHPLVAAAMAEGVRVDNETGLFFASLGSGDWADLDVPPRVIAVAGGGPTARLVHHMLGGAGRPAQLAGASGCAPLAIEVPQSGEVIVLELTGRQLGLARGLTPDVAVLAGFEKGAGEAHGGAGWQFAALRRLFAEGGPDRAVVGFDDPEGVFLANQLSVGRGDDRVIRVSATRKLAGAGWNVFVRKGFLAEWRKARQVASLDLRQTQFVQSEEALRQVCAAYAAVRALGVAPRQIEAALRTFQL